MEWISVEDNEPVGTCLVYAPDEDSTRNPYHVGVYHDNLTVIGNHFEFDMPKVTHWMPITPC